MTKLKIKSNNINDLQILLLNVGSNRAIDIIYLSSFTNSKIFFKSLRWWLVGMLCLPPNFGIYKIPIYGIFFIILLFITMVQLECRGNGGMIPIEPESSEYLFKNSDVIAYVKVLEVTKIKKRYHSEPLSLGARIIFPRQLAKVRFLKILKGSQGLKDTTATIVKSKSFNYLSEGQEVVVYLKKVKGRYQTINLSGWEWRLASTLANINNLKADGCGVVVGVLLNKDKRNFHDFKIHILKGRHKAPIILGDQVIQTSLLKTEEVGKFNISEVPLDHGTIYIILLEVKGGLHSHNRLVNGYYPYILLEENEWRVVYFDINEIIKEGSRIKCLKKAKNWVIYLIKGCSLKT